MDDRKPVSAGALYATSFAGAVVSAVSVSPHLFGDGYLEALLTIAVSLVVTSLAAVPALCLAKENIDLLEVARLRLGKAAVLVSVFYYAVLVYFSFYFLSFFLIFIENTLDPATPVWAVALCVALAAAYGARQGLPAVSRAGLFAFALIIVGFGFIFVLLLKDMDLAALYDPGEPALNLPSAALFTAGRATSLVHLVLFLPRMQGRRVSGFWILNTGFHLLCVVIVFFLAVCLGGMASVQLFPVYTLAQLANFGAVQRLDIVFLFLWIVGIVMRLCLDLLAGASLFRFRDTHLLTGKSTRFPKKLWLVLAQALAAAVAAALVADHFSLQRWLFSSQTVTYVALFAGVVVPLLLLCLERFCRGRKEAHHEN